jgi:hypothetical protein
MSALQLATEWPDAMPEAEGQTEAVKDSRPTYPPILDGTEAVNLYGQKVPPEVIKGILHQGSKMVIGGGSKSFKTWSLMDLALSVAAGGDWWNIPTTQGRVLYLNLELQAFAFAQRQNVISKAKGITLQREQLDVWHLRGFCADLAQMSVQIIEQARNSRYALIVIDPVYKCMGGRDENKAGDIGSLLNEVERLAVQTGAAVVFGAHFSKGNQAGKESLDRVSGSGVFARDPDSILTLTRHEADDAFTVEATLRNFPQLESFVLRWQYPLMVRDENLNPAKLKKVIGRESRYSVGQIVDCLNGSEMKTGVLQRRVCEETGMSKAAFFRLLTEGAEQGILSKSGITQEWEAIKRPNGK